MCMGEWGVVCCACIWRWQAEAMGDWHAGHSIGTRLMPDKVFFDSLILASALEAGCQILYSEDLQDGQRIENQLMIVNPFS